MIVYDYDWLQQVSIPWLGVEMLNHVFTFKCVKFIPVTIAVVEQRCTESDFARFCLLIRVIPLEMCTALLPLI